MKYSLNNKCVIIGVVILFFGTSITPCISGDDDTPLSGLPRWREGGTPYDCNQSLYPYAIYSSNSKDSPTSGLIESPPEYGPTQGVLFCFNNYQNAVVCDLVVALTEDDQYDEIAYVWVSSTSMMNSAISMFTSGGANMSKVEFIIEPINSIWVRDYGPHFIWQNGTLGLVDSHYYQSRSYDNFVPTLLGDDHFIMPTYDMGLYYSGGNFQPGPNRTGFATSLVNIDNPASQGFNESFIAELFQKYQGIDTLHIMPQLPVSVDGTGHIDMWLNIIDEDTVIISKFKPGSNPTAIQITDDAVPYMESLGFEVYRTPAWNVGGTHYTYTNAFRVNDRIFIPYYAEGNSGYSDEDDGAFDNFSAAAGAGVEIIPIDCYDIIPAAGAIHCIVMQVPRYTEPEPAVHVIWPDGDELLVSETTQTISWAATDTYNAVIPQIDLYYSINGGNTYEFIDTTTDTGSYDWTVPDIKTEQAKIKVVAVSSDLDQGEAESTGVFQITSANQSVYDFVTNVSVNKFCYGSSTSSWNQIDNDRTPVGIEISSSDYPKIAYSDATGGDSDPNRYISPDPSTYYESTHVYEFTINEDSEYIKDIEIFWEGYADYCTQIEIYVWDYIEEQWGNGEGVYGQNHYMDNWAGNRDGYFNKHIRSNFDHYISPSGQMTILLYAERSSDRSFHDYISITVSSGEPDPMLSFSPSSFDFGSMLANETDFVTFDVWNNGAGMLNYTLSEFCDWVSVVPLIGNSSGEHDTINVSINTTGLDPGPHHCDIHIDSNGGNDVFGVDVTVVTEGTEFIDVNQSVFDRGFPIRHAIDGDWAGAQNFTATVDTITRVEVYLRKFGTPEFELTVELRTGGPQGALLDTVVFTPGEVASSWTWLNVDFTDVAVTPGTDYFIVLPPAPSGVTTSFGYEWGYAFGNQYDPGSFWFTRDGGGLWRDLPTMYEFVFRTYGYY